MRSLDKDANSNLTPYIYILFQDVTSNSWDYFEKNYGPEGKVAKPQEWARCFIPGTVATNLLIER